MAVKMQYKNNSALQSLKYITMRILICFILVVLVSSCTDDTRIASLQTEVDQLSSQISLLQNRLDSFTLHDPEIKTKLKKRGQSSDLKTTTQASSYSSSQYTPPNKITVYSGRCQATTKKGTQCKRSAKYGGYCWQHG